MNYVYSVIVIALLSFATWYTKHQFDSGYAKCVAEYKTAESTKKTEWIERNELLQAEVNRLSVELLNERSRPDYVHITKSVQDRLGDNRSCDYSVDTVRLLNDATKRHKRQPTENIRAATSDAEVKTSDTVTR